MSTTLYDEPRLAKLVVLSPEVRRLFQTPRRRPAPPTLWSRLWGLFTPEQRTVRQRRNIVHRCPHCLAVLR